MHIANLLLYSYPKFLHILLSFSPGSKPSSRQDNKSKWRKTKKNAKNSSSVDNKGNNVTNDNANKLVLVEDSNHGEMVCYIKIELNKFETNTVNNKEQLDKGKNKRKRKRSKSFNSLEPDKKKQSDLPPNTTRADTADSQISFATDIGSAPTGDLGNTSDTGHTWIEDGKGCSENSSNHGTSEVNATDGPSKGTVKQECEVHAVKSEDLITIAPHNDTDETPDDLKETVDSKAGLVSQAKENTTNINIATEASEAPDEETLSEMQQDEVPEDANPPEIYPTSSSVKPVNLVTVLHYPDKTNETTLVKIEGDATEDVKTINKQRVRGKRRPRKSDIAARKREKADDVDASWGIPTSDETACTICCDKFDSHELLKEHVKRSGHYERNWMCKLCYIRFIVRKSLKEHIEYVHKNESSHHKRCMKTYDPNVDYKINLRETVLPHLDNPIPCELCDKMVKGKCMEFHLKTHEGDKGRRRRRILRCYYCGLCFTRPANLLKHRRLEHNNYFDCDLCGGKFNGKHPLKMHRIRVHGEDSDIKCEICGKRFARPDQLRNHRSSHTDVSLVKCTLCDKTFKNRSRLCQHVNLVHGMSLTDVSLIQTKADESGGHEYVCTKCGGVFNGVDSLKLHFKDVHPDEKREERTPGIKSERRSQSYHEELCTQCGKVLKGRYSLLQHQKMMHPADETDKHKYKCTTCGKSFTGKGYLNLHAEWHLMKENPDAHGGNARYKCPFCDRGFKYKTILKTHKKTHKEFKAMQPDESIQCTICGATLKSENSLKDHMDNHEGLLKFPCTKCDKVFPSRGRLYNHHITHKDVSYQCDFCGASYKQKSYLKRHIANKHAESG